MTVVNSLEKQLLIRISWLEELMMSQHHNCPCGPQCALQSALGSIGGKWKLPILCSLTQNGSSRYNALLHNVQGISNTMLSQTLKELEQDHLILRKEYLEVPVRVEYELSEKAKKLQPILLDLIRWFENCE
jgi:DNA-binding HxlR family transcriptional regulator